MLIIDTKNVSGAIGPYPQAYETNGLIITSDQLPISPADGAIPEGIAVQIKRSRKNMGVIPEAVGSSLDKVVKTTCFLADIAGFAAFSEAHTKYPTSGLVRSCAAMKGLPKDALREIEAIAVRQAPPCIEGGFSRRSYTWEIRSFFTCPQWLL